MKHSEWVEPTNEELHELEYTQIDEAAGGNGNGNGKGNNVPINNGIVIVLIFVIIFGIWKQSRISPRSTSES